MNSPRSLKSVELSTRLAPDNASTVQRGSALIDHRNNAIVEFTHGYGRGLRPRSNRATMNSAGSSSELSRMGKEESWNRRSEN